MHARHAVVLVLWLLLAGAPPAHADFPYQGNGTPSDYADDRQPDGAGKAPADLSSKEAWMYAATPEAGNEPVNSQAFELNGIRGARLTDAADVDVAWRTTVGRPDVVIAVHDSGIKWDDLGAMRNVRKKTHLNAGELPTPNHARTAALEPGVTCSSYRDADDANGDGVFNIVDFACDDRVESSGDARVARSQPRGNGRDELLDPQDVLIAFSLGEHHGDGDGNGFVDDIVGWDFLDNDNDAYDDVQYGHGTGEIQDSVAEAANEQGGAGTCPNCMAMPIRVGDSFVADINRFAQGVIYSTDNGVSVVQEALGALNNSRLARRAVEYAHRHGVTIIASAADEAAQHRHWPEAYPHVIVVNSVTQYDSTFTPVPKSYLQFTGCTNFSSKIAIAIPSVSCSSDATGRGSGMAGLVYAAALNARANGTIGDAPRAVCERTDGSACAITPDEVHQLMAAGELPDGPLPDDVDFSMGSVTCSPLPLPGCTDPNINTVLGTQGAVLSPLVTTRRYPAKKGHDQFYGYGRVNMARSLGALRTGKIPPAVEIQSPDWAELVDSTKPSADIGAEIFSRASAGYTCRVLVAPGSYPDNGEGLTGDFQVVPSPWCDGTTKRTTRFDGVVASLDIAALKKRFPASAGSFDGREPGIGVQTSSGRPNTEPYGFVVKVVATATVGGVALKGQDRRNLSLHRDSELLPGWPRRIGGGTAGSGDVESSPLFTDLDGDERTELLIAGSDGIVHAYRRDGGELDGWPVKTDRLPLHDAARAFTSGEVSDDARGAILASLAAGDLDRDGEPEIVAADLEGKIYVWRADGSRMLTVETNPAYSGKPLSPFAPERRGKLNRTQHGFLASPVLADVDRNDGGRLEIVGAAMDRHVYVWNDDGTLVEGFPTIVVDPAKVAAIDPASHRVSFKSGVGADQQQGAIVDTPAVGDLDKDGRPEIVVGTNEEYSAAQDGGFNSAPVNAAAIALIEPLGILELANSRLFAIKPTGDPDGDLLSGPSPYLDGWPAKIAKVFAELLPVVGEGITGSPVIGVVDCLQGGSGPKVGTIPDGGPAMVLNPDSSSCIGTVDGKPIGMQADIPTGNPLRADIVTLPAVGHPAFGNVGGAGTSFVAPTTGILRALDLAVNEYQGGEDSVSAWDPTTGQFRLGFPARTNDLAFLTGPSVGDIGGLPGEEVVAGTAYQDLQAFGAAGLPPSTAWPKLTGDWMVANPLLGTFGELEDAPDARRVVVAATRAGVILPYRTSAAACAAASWPRFHHDEHNSGDARTDAVAPGAVRALARTGSTLTFTAPADDRRCGGKVAGYEIVDAAGGSVNGRTRGWAPVEGVSVAAPGSTQSLTLPAGTRRVVGVRAVDEQGNVSRARVVTVPVVVPDTPADPPVDPPVGAGQDPRLQTDVSAPGATPDATRGTTDSLSSPAGTVMPASSGCRDVTAPTTRPVRAPLRASRSRIVVGGRARDLGCGARVRRVDVAVALRSAGGCRFLGVGGRPGRRRACAPARGSYVAATGTTTWRRTFRGTFPRGTWLVWSRAVDGAGNIEALAPRRNRLAFDIR
jgi:hypothetical protein